METKIEWAGPYLPDYFPGAGTACTPWDDVSTGSGSTIEEAYEEAVEFAFQAETPPDDAFPEWEASGLPAYGLEAFGLDEDSESLFFVTIYYNRKDGMK